MADLFGHTASNPTKPSTKHKRRKTKTDRTRHTQKRRTHTHTHTKQQQKNKNKNWLCLGLCGTEMQIGQGKEFRHWDAGRHCLSLCDRTQGTCAQPACGWFGHAPKMLPKVQFRCPISLSTWRADFACFADLKENTPNDRLFPQLGNLHTTRRVSIPGSDTSVSKGPSTTQSHTTHTHSHNQLVWA